MSEEKKTGIDFNQTHWPQFWGNKPDDPKASAEKTKKRRQEFHDKFDSTADNNVRYKFFAMAEEAKNKIIIKTMTNTMEGAEGADIDNQYEFYTPSFEQEFTQLGSHMKYKNLSFIRKACIEILVSNNELTWSDIEKHILAPHYYNKDHSLSEFIADLRRISVQGYRSAFIFKDFSRFTESQTKVPEGFELGNFSSLMLGMTVTNNSVKFEGPFIKDLNRVTDEYGADLFLTVKFNPIPTRDYEAIKTAYKHLVYKGVKFAGRTYEFLACSASQFREGQCFYFAKNVESVDRPGRTDLDSEKVRECLGDFSKMRSVAEYSTRLGQAFSSAIPTIRIPTSAVSVIEDIKRGDKTWTDGNGEVLAVSAAQIAEKLNLNYVPTCIQMRWGGAKGVIVNYRKSTDDAQKLMILRKSMVKYEITNPSEYQETVYVIKYSKSRSASLCAQFILGFYELGVEPETFINMLHKSIDNDKQRNKKKSDKHSNRMITSEESAFKIFDPCGRYLFGVIDKDGFLEEGEVFINLKNKGVVTGRVAVTKSPCMHPGDIRLLKAQDIPQLYGLVDVIVFPSKGKRPTADMIANSDVDGDEFFATWNPSLTNIKPQPPAPTLQKGKEITITSKNSMIHGVYEYFINNLYPKIISDISNYHMCYADQLGVGHPLCIELAELFSKAIDSAKTGEIVRIPAKFYIEKFPHFLPHLGKGGKRHSDGILGQIYDEFNRYR
eukprot:Phypoly_transcript_04021.p1 GENE.Phypoly_transcript_04021~~Phypoly_transcript_04021.p1  ORF type:complete len:720 (+),score=100.17 Phypoly_transcript_04021:60-2219(+)